MGSLLIMGGVVAFAIGVYIGIGAPGLPVKPSEGGNLKKRSINPVAWGGRSSTRERQRPGRHRRDEQREDRRPRFR